MQFHLLNLLVLLLIVPPVGAIDLEQAYELALQNDSGWHIAQAEAEEGKEQLVQAEALWLPNVSLSGSHSRVQLDRERMGATDPTQYYDSENLTLALTQSLLNEPQQARLLQAREQVNGIEAKLELKKGELLERVITSYFSILMADDVIEQLLAEEKSNRVQLEAAKRAYDLGQGTRTDIDEAQARLDMVTVERLQAEQQSRYSRTELSTLVGEPVKQLKVLDTVALIPKTPTSTLEVLVAQAEQSSAQLRMLQAAVRVASKRVEEIRGERYPTLDLYLQRSYSESDSVNAIGSRDNTAQIGIQFNLSLYDGGGVTSRIRQAESALQQAQAQRYQILDQLKLQVHKEYQNVTETAARITALKQLVRSASQLVHSTHKGIIAGTRTTVDWLNAQQRRSDAIQQLLMSQYEYLLSSIRLDKLVGKDAVEIVSAVNSLLVMAGQKKIQLPQYDDQEGEKVREAYSI